MRLQLKRWILPCVLLRAGLPADKAAAAAADDPAAMTIHVTVVERHDRVTPTPIRGIVKRNDVDVVVKPNKEIHESARMTDMGSHPLSTTGQQSATLGDESANVAWHVLGPNKLQRFYQRPNTQLLSVWTIETDANRGCHIDVKMLMQEGTAVTAGNIQGTNTPATFTNYKVLQATCSIE
jgi:hypothetical protein